MLASGEAPKGWSKPFASIGWYFSVSPLTFVKYSAHPDRPLRARPYRII